MLFLSFLVISCIICFDLVGHRVIAYIIGLSVAVADATVIGPSTDLAKTCLSVSDSDVN